MFQWYGLTLWSLKERDNIFSEDEIAAAFADKRWSTRDMLHRVKAFYNIHRLTSLELLPTVCELQINTNLSIAQRLTWSFNDIKEASINSSVRMRAKHLYLLKIHQQLTHVVQGVKRFYDTITKSSHIPQCRSHPASVNSTVVNKTAQKVKYPNDTTINP